MARLKNKGTGRRLQPRNKLLFVRADHLEWLPPESVTLELVGQKAYGLSAIPAPWTLPFFSISAELLGEFLRSGTQAVNHWLDSIRQAMEMAGLSHGDKVLVRSSGCSEDMNARGGLHTVEGDVQSIQSALIDCLSKLSKETVSAGNQIPILIQKACSPVRSRGHLSNERRCYEEHRDWIGEIESVDPDTSATFQINLRHWREQIQPNPTSQLSCTLTPYISDTLKRSAEWAYAENVRVHFEWVWDGATLYLVQADEEVNLDGFDPIAQYKEREYRPVSFTPQALRLVSADDAVRFAKIRNVFIYLKLKLPTAPLYILDDPLIIGQLGRGEISQAIESDINALVGGSLVIRMDLATEVLAKRQLLPRTQEVRTKEEATDWLIKQCLLLSEMNEVGVFLFHNFIPAYASAFAYAAPGEPIVQIEGLWGLPEGLYYNTHDKFVVDTKNPDIRHDQGAEQKYSVRTRANFKRNYVAPTSDGKWETCSLRAPYDWKPALNDEQCRYIAHQSRRIAEEQGFPISIMWFIGVPKEMASQPMIPWYHERFDSKIGRLNITSRTKTPFDRCFVVRKASDVAALRNSSSEQIPLRRIRVQPQEESLLRDKNTLKNIGEAALQHDAVIVLEGAVLSHAYYQLLQTGAIVEVVHPFVGFEDKIIYNKLVRDKIPEIIRKRGERIAAATLDQESHIKALREKLVEEAYELLDARDINSVLAEMADVETVVQALCKQYKISRAKLEREIAAKKEERGGFESGIVLLETENLLPTSKVTANGQLQLVGVEDDVVPLGVIDSNELLKRTSVIDRRIDRQVGAGTMKIIAAAEIGVTRRNWELETKEESTSATPRKVFSGIVRGERDGAQWRVEIAVQIQDAQAELL